MAAACGQYVTRLQRAFKRVTRLGLVPAVVCATVFLDAVKVSDSIGYVTALPAMLAGSFCQEA